VWGGSTTFPTLPYQSNPNVRKITGHFLSLSFPLFFFLSLLDYTKSKETFEKWVEDDTYSFKPFGELVQRYRSAEVQGEGEENIVEYEIYHVGFGSQDLLEL
jgi:hypothetical protein